MFLETYIINERLQFMGVIYDRRGNQCTYIQQTDGVFIVERSPVRIIDDSIKSIGFDFKGAMKSAKWHLGEVHMCPIMINPVLSICLFPSGSFRNDTTIWFNPRHILRTINDNQKTYIKFKNGRGLMLPCKLGSFNNKLLKADQLRRLVIENANNPNQKKSA